MISMKAVLKLIDQVKKVRKADYSLEYTCTGNYHLMKGKNYIVIDEPLLVISVVLKAMINDRKKVLKSS